MTKVMIVEDSMDIQLILKHLFMSEGHEVECANNGQEALSLLNSLDVLPNFILLDLMMPVMNGFEFRDEQIRNPRLANIPVFIMSADYNIHSKKITTSASEAFVKPINIDELLETTKRYCQ